MIKVIGYKNSKIIDYVNKKDDKSNKFKDISRRILSCKKCKNVSIHTIGYGNLNSEIMFVLQSPHYTHNKNYLHVCCFGIKQQPYGKTGWFIEEVFKQMKKTKENYYFTNIVKCSQNNSEMLTDEMKQNCITYFKEELDLVKPKKIIALGNYSFKLLKSLNLDIPIFKFYHPSFCIKNNISIEEYAKKLSEVL